MRQTGTNVKRKAVIAQLGAGIALVSGYSIFRLYPPLPAVLFPETARLSSIDLLGGLMLVPALILFARCAGQLLTLRWVDRLTNLVVGINPALFVCLAAAAAFVVSLLFSLLVLDGIPHVQDSIVSLFQAKVFAEGKVGVAPPRHPEFFSYPFLVVENGLMHSKYLPMHSLTLALGVLANAPFIVGPILAAASLSLIFLLARELLGTSGAKAATLLALASPFFLFMHASYLSHTSSLLWLTLAYFSLIRVLRTKSRAFALLCGVSFGFAFNTRPQTAFVVGLALLPMVVYELFRQKRRAAVACILAFGLGLVPGIALTLGYRYLFTGKVLAMPFDLSNPTDRLGFSPDVGDLYGSIGHTPLKAWYNFSRNFVEMSSNLFGFPLTSLLFFFVVIGSRRKARWERAFLAVPVSLALFLVFYWVDGVCFGARYYFCCLPLLAILSIRGADRFGRLLGPGRRGRRAVVLLVLSLIGLDVFDYLPRRIALHRKSYWSVNGRLADAVRERGLHNAVILMKTEDDPLCFGSGFLENSPTFDGDIVYARHLGRTRDRLLFSDYPKRRFFICTWSTTLDRQPLFEQIWPLPEAKMPPEQVENLVETAKLLLLDNRLTAAQERFSFAMLANPEVAARKLPLHDRRFVAEVLPRLSLVRPQAFLAIGLRFYSLGRTEQARLYIESAVRMSPRTICTQLPLDDPSFRRQVADRLDLRGKEALSALAQQFMHYSQYRRSARLLKREIEIYGADYGLLVKLGDAQLGLGNGQGALATFEAAHGLSPLGPEAILGRARALSLLGDTSSAERAIRNAVPLRPDPVQLCVAMGEYALALGRPARARKSFLLALAHDERNIEATVSLAQLLLCEGDVDGALDVLQRLRPTEPNDRRLNLLLGICWWASGEHERAGAYLRRALRLSDRGKLEWSDLAILSREAKSPKLFKALEQLCQRVI